MLQHAHVRNMLATHWQHIPSTTGDAAKLNNDMHSSVPTTPGAGIPGIRCGGCGRRGPEHIHEREGVMGGSERRGGGVASEWARKLQEGERRGGGAGGDGFRV
jgi:hypothetical protein